MPSRKDFMEWSTRFGKPMLVTPCVGVSVTVPTSCQLGDVICTISEHLPGLICHVAVGPVVDDHVVDDVLDVRLVLLQYPVLGCLTLAHHLLKINVSLQKKFYSPLLLTKTCKCFSVSRIYDTILTNR